MNNSVIVSLRDIVVEFDGQRILDGLNLDIHDKEFVTLLGSSGCGKTTTLRMIAGFEDVSSGDICIDGSSVIGVPPYKRQVNTAFQSYALFPHLSVYDNIAYGLKLKKVSKAEIHESVSHMLSLIRLDGYEKRKPAQLSGGQKQRAAVCRAINTRPELILADEPTGALDSTNGNEVMALLQDSVKKLNQTLVLITHNIDLAREADRIVRITDGKLPEE